MSKALEAAAMLIACRYLARTMGPVVTKSEIAAHFAANRATYMREAAEYVAAYHRAIAEEEDAFGRAVEAYYSALERLRHALRELEPKE